LKILQDVEIQQLIGFLRKRTNIIIPKCFIRRELVKLLQMEGLPHKLSDKEFAQIKQDYDDNCTEIMRHTCEPI